MTAIRDTLWTSRVGTGSPRTSVTNCSARRATRRAGVTSSAPSSRGRRSRDRVGSDSRPPLVGTCTGDNTTLHTTGTQPTPLATPTRPPFVPLLRPTVLGQERRRSKTPHRGRKGPGAASGPPSSQRESRRPRPRPFGVLPEGTSPSHPPSRQGTRGSTPSGKSKICYL